MSLKLFKKNKIKANNLSLSKKSNMTYACHLLMNAN